MRSSRPKTVLAALLLLCGLALPASAQTPSEETWRGLRPDLFGDAPIRENSPLVTLTAPTRAEDAAFVPVEVRAALPAGDGRTTTKITLIVDENPAPLAAAFRLGPERREAMLSTRLRVNSYSWVRAVAQTSDGELHMSARYVKAAGGCSAPALKDQDESLARLGEMRLRALGPAPEGAAQGALPRAQLMIRHPNYSGLQMNQLTRHYIPAKFVNQIVVKQGEELVFEMEGGISLSEDPVIGFDYPPKGGALQGRAGDTDGRSFTKAGDGQERGAS